MDLMREIDLTIRQYHDQSGTKTINLSTQLKWINMLYRRLTDFAIFNLLISRQFDND